MALSANTVWEVRTAGNDTNGGGFVTGASGSDYSMQDAKNSGGNDSSTTDAVAVGTTTITSATASFQTTIVGNIVYFAGGTGSIVGVWREVKTRASSTSITIDSAIAASTGMTMNIGGALLSPAIAAASAQSGNEVYIKAGTYSITSASTNIVGGCLSMPGSSVIEGYQTTRGDLNTKPLLQASGISTFTIVSSGTSRSAVNNIEVDGAGLTASRGISCRGLVTNCKADNCTNAGFVDAVYCLFSNCAATGCSTQPAFLVVTQSNYVNCVAYSNTITGFSSAGVGTTYVRCISAANSGASSDGFTLTGVSSAFFDCVAYTNGRDGFSTTDTTVFHNCIAEGNTSGTGFKTTGASVDYTLLRSCAGFNNSADTAFTGTAPTYTLNTGFVTLTGSPFTNAGAGDFSLNNTASAGAACRAAGFPGALQYGGTGYLDIGALQHADPASGSGHGRYVFTNGGVDG